METKTRSKTEKKIDNKNESIEECTIIYPLNKSKHSYAFTPDFARLNNVHKVIDSGTDKSCVQLIRKIRDIKEIKNPKNSKK